MSQTALQNDLCPGSKVSCYTACGFFVTVILCLVAPRALSFLPGTFALLTLAGMIIRSGTTNIHFDRHLAALLAIGVALIAVSSLWAYDSAEALERAWKAGAVMLGGFLIITLAKSSGLFPIHKNFAAFSAFLCGVSGLILWVEYHFTFPITCTVFGINEEDMSHGMQTGYLINRNTVFLVLFSLPCFLALYLSDLKTKTKLLLAAFTFFGVVMALSAAQSQTAQIALALAVLGFLYPAHNKKARTLLTAVLCLGILTAPLWPSRIKDMLHTEDMANDGSWVWEASIPHRLEVWNFIADEIAKKPVLGHGVDATPHLRSEKIMPFMRTNTVLHPHNAALQMWLEFGVLGAAFAISMVIFLMRRIEALPPLLQHYYTMLVVVTLGILMVAYGLWQAWQLGMIMAIPAFSMMATNHFLRDGKN
jgi:exopolysaccharide production protein ExoQ